MGQYSSVSLLETTAFAMESTRYIYRAQEAMFITHGLVQCLFVPKLMPKFWIQLW